MKYMKNYDDEFKKKLIEKWDIVHEHIAYVYEEKEDYDKIEHSEGDVSNHIYEHTLELNNLIDQLKLQLK